MARPKTKSELLILSRQNFENLFDYIEGLDAAAQQKEFPEGTLNRNIRDVLAHLHHWHLMVLEWYDVGMQSKKPDMPAKGYTWKTTPDLNRWIQKEYNTTALTDAESLVKDSYKKVQTLINWHSDEELFQKKY